MPKMQMRVVILILLCLTVAESACGDLTIFTWNKKEPVAARLDFVKEQLRAGRNTVIMHMTASGKLLIAELKVDSKGTSIFTVNEDAAEWANALGEAGNVKTITFEEVAAELGVDDAKGK